MNKELHPFIAAQMYLKLLIEEGVPEDRASVTLDINGRAMLSLYGREAYEKVQLLAESLFCSKEWVTEMFPTGQFILKSDAGLWKDFEEPKTN